MSIADELPDHFWSPGGFVGADPTAPEFYSRILWAVFAF
jgi:hypothetical protein